MKKYLYYIISAVFVFLVGFFSARHTSPERIVTKEVEVVKTVVQKDTKTIIKKVKSPDGTVTTEIVKEDKSNINQNTSKNKETIVNNEKQWKATLFTSFEAIARPSEASYAASIERRIVGPIFVGVWGSTQGNGGVSVSVEF